MKFIIIAMMAMMGSLAMADQCQWNSRANAEGAADLINFKHEILKWCQNCGERNPSNIIRVERATAHKIENSGTPGSWNVEITYPPPAPGKVGATEEIDLAYFYARTDGNTFTNIAHMVGCPTTGAVSFVQTFPVSESHNKVAHYYDEKGERRDTATSPNEVSHHSIKNNGRQPGSQKK